MPSASRKPKRGAEDAPSGSGGPKKSRPGKRAGAKTGAKNGAKKGAEDEAGEPSQVKSVDADLPFEAALTQLQAIVDRLEGGELELEDAVEAFADGARLTRRCSEALSAAERRIEVLAEQGGEWLTRPFDSNLSDDLSNDLSDEGENEEELGDDDWDEAGG